MNVRWSVGDEYLVTVGGNDKCILLWRHIMEETISCGVEKMSIHDGSGSGEPDEESEEIDVPPELPTGIYYYYYCYYH